METGKWRFVGVNGRHWRDALLAFPWEGKVARRPDEVEKPTL